MQTQMTASRPFSCRRLHHLLLLLTMLLAPVAPLMWPATAHAQAATQAQDASTQDASAQADGTQANGGDAGGPPAADKATRPDATPEARLTPEERAKLHALLSTPDGRAALAQAQTQTQTGSGKTATAPAAQAAPAAAPAKADSKSLTVAPDSLAGEVLGGVSVLQRGLVQQSHGFTRLFADGRLVGLWLHREMVNRDARAILLNAAWRSAVVILVALAAEHLLLLALRRPLRSLGRSANEVQDESFAPEEDPEVPGLVRAGPPVPPAQLAPAPLPGDPLPGSPRLPETPLPQNQDAGAADAALLREEAERRARHAEARSRDAAHRQRALRLFRRLPFAVLRLILKLVPLGLFLAIGNLAATTVAEEQHAQLIIVATTNIYGVGRAIWLVFDMLFSPQAPGVRLVHMTDATAGVLLRWLSWLLALPMVAICFTDIGRILGLPARGALAITRGMVLVEHLLIAALIWRVRRRVAIALHPPKRMRNRPLGRALARLADMWWIPALFFDAALWVVWAEQIRGGYARMWQIFLSTVIVVGACRFVAVLLLGALDRTFRIDPHAELRYPGIEMRASRYYPAVRRIVTWALLLVGTVALLQVWGVPAVGFFTHNTLGTKLLSAAITILITLAVGVAIWEIVNGALDRQISRLRDTNQGARAVRLQTLLPILRTLLFVVLGAIMLLTALSQIGVNIAPLLAGAGIVGVAVGFGSQKLVQDFITGIFLLVENAMQVGDTVTVAGVTGTVEHLSIRTLRLRGGDGSIQIIPFSSVSTVANMSRDFQVAAISISVAFSQDTDQVVALMAEIGAQMRNEEPYSSMMLADWSLNGVDSIGEYAVALSGTIKCTVSGRWPVQREFYRRLRQRMAELGIALPQAHQSLVLRDMPMLAHALEHGEGAGDGGATDAKEAQPHE